MRAKPRVNGLPADVRRGMADVRRAQRAQTASLKLLHPALPDTCVVCKRPIPSSAVCIPAVTSCRRAAVVEGKATWVIEQAPIGAICVACAARGLQKPQDPDTRASPEAPCCSP